MKRYELLILTALVIFLFSMLCPLPCDGGRLTDPTARKAPRVAYGASAAICEPMREKFYVRSRCEGYLAVDQRKDRKNKRIKNKVILQRVGINDTHPLAMVVKETCVRVPQSRQPQARAQQASRPLQARAKRQVHLLRPAGQRQSCGLPASGEEGSAVHVRGEAGGRLLPHHPVRAQRRLAPRLQPLPPLPQGTSAAARTEDEPGQLSCAVPFRPSPACPQSRGRFLRHF